jgi:DnaK suppressor protein
VAKQASKKSPAKKAPKPVERKPAAAKAMAKKPAVAAKASKPVEKAPAKLPAKIPAKIVEKPSKSTVLKKSIATRAEASTPARAIPAPRRIVAEPERPMMPVPVPVPTNGKPRKNQAGLSSKELEFFRDMILQKRREIVGDMSQMEREALRSASGSNLSNLPLHMADMGTDNYEQEFTLGLVEKDRNLLRDLNGALAKIMDGTYGICEGTGKPISKVRLEAQPWARFSIEYARKMEKGFIR